MRYDVNNYSTLENESNNINDNENSQANDPYSYASCQEQYRKKNSELIECNNSSTSQNTSIKSNEKELEKWNKKNETIIKSIDSLKKEIAILSCNSEKIEESLKQQLANMQNQLITSENTKQKNDNQLADLQISLNEFTNIREKIVELAKKEKELNDKIATFTNELAISEDSQKITALKKVQFEKELNQLKHGNQRLNDLTKSANELHDQISKLHIELENVKDTQESLEKQSNHLTNNLKDLELKKQKINEEIAISKNELRDFHDKKDKLSFLKFEEIAINKQINNLYLTLNSSKDKESGLENQKTILEKKLENFQAQKSKNQSQIAELEKKLSEFANIEQSLVELEANEIKLEQQINKLQAELLVLESSEQLMQERNHHLELQLQVLQTKKDDLIEQKNRLQKDWSELKIIHQQIINLQKNSITLKQEIEHKQLELHNLLSSKEKLQDQVHKLQKDLSEFATIKQNIQNLEKDIKNLEKEIEIAKLTLEMSEFTEKELRNTNISLNERFTTLQNNEKTLTNTINNLKNQLKLMQEKFDEKNSEKNLQIICDDNVPKIKNPNDKKEVINWIVKYIEKSVPYSSKYSNGMEYKKSQATIIKEVSQVEPSTILLCNQKYDDLALKVFMELIMVDKRIKGFPLGSGLFGQAHHISNGSLGSKKFWHTGESSFFGFKRPIPGIYNWQIIHNSSMLFKSQNQLYFDQIYKVIENYIKSFGLDCSVEKTFHYFTNQNDEREVVATIGSLYFPAAKTISSSKSLNYYLQISFEIKIKHLKLEIPICGFTMLLSSSLDLYQVN